MSVIRIEGRQVERFPSGQSLVIPSPPRAVTFSFFRGQTPSAGVQPLVIPVQYSPDDPFIKYTFSLKRATWRVETVGTTDSKVVLQRSPGGNQAFSATDLLTITLPASTYQKTWTEDELKGCQVTSSDLLRLNVSSVGSGSQYWSLWIEGVVVK